MALKQSELDVVQAIVEDELVAGRRVEVGWGRNSAWSSRPTNTVTRGAARPVAR